MKKEERRRHMATIYNGWLLAILLFIPTVVSIVEHYSV